jgi:hypothetical protein
MILGDKPLILDVVLSQVLFLHTHSGAGIDLGVAAMECRVEI